MYIGGWGVEGCKRQAGDARDAHAHARFLVFHVIQAEWTKSEKKVNYLSRESTLSFR